jgi:hypothetical protein
MAKFGRFITGLMVAGATIGAGLGVGVLAAAPAGAATAYTVTDAGDGAGPFDCVTPGGDCSLRAAITAANTSGGDAVITLPDANSVAFNKSTTHIYSLSTANGSLVLNSGHTITINGAGSTLAILQMQGAPVTNRVLQVGTGTTADISGITAEDGVITGVGPGGGGILNDGTLNLSSSTVTGNSSANSGGGVYLDGVAAILTNDTITANSAGSGGGLTMENGTNVISGGSVDGNNTTSSEGGGVDIEDLNPGDSASLSNVDVSSNTSGVDGGGLYVGNQSATSNNPVTLTNVTADNNTADGSGGGLYVSNDGAGGGTLTMTGGSASGNSCGEDGGGIYDQNDGSGSVHFIGVSVNSNTVANNGTGTGAGGGIYVQNDGSGDTTTFSGGSIDNNSTPTNVTNGQGGGVYLLNNGNPSMASFSGGTISNNSAYEGGGVALPPGSFPTRTGDLATFTNETVSGNHVTEAGGGFTDDAGAVQPLTIASSTISGNSAGSLATSDGGGIEAIAPSTSCDSITLTNDTITGNTAVNGGGYYGAGCTSPTVASAFEFDTISGNTATNTAGAGNIQTIDGSALTLADSIVANGSASGGAATNCLLTGGGSLTSGGYNLIDNTNCGSPAATDIIGKNPQLGSLANNGGPTQTEEPAAASPAVGAIPSAACSGTGVSTDQRGDPRGTGANGSCTIGSVEVEHGTPPAPPPPPPNSPNGYRLVGNDGGIFDFGLNYNGSLATIHLNSPIIGIANSRGLSGYLMASGDGGVFALGGANFYGSLGGKAIPSPIAAIAAPPAENGYWLAAQNGKIYPFGSAPPLPTVPLPPRAKIVGMASTTDGMGAWLTDQFGDVYAEGTALYKGGLGGVHINAPIVGIAAAAFGQGYVLAAADGGVFRYGTQGFFGSVPGSLKPGQHLVAPIVGIAVTHSGNGYWEVGADGGLFNYGDAPFLGNIYTTVPGGKLNGPIVGIQHLGSAAA